MPDYSKGSEAAEILDKDEVETIKNALNHYIAKTPSDKFDAVKVRELFSVTSMYFFDSKIRFADFAPHLRKTLTNALSEYGNQNPADSPNVLCLLAELLQVPTGIG